MGKRMVRTDMSGGSNIGHKCRILEPICVG